MSPSATVGNSAASATHSTTSPDPESIDKERRMALLATAVVGGLGTVASAIPFVSTFAPSERAKAAGAPVEVDITHLAEGERMVVEWRGKPVWVIRRSPEMMASLDKTAGNLADPNSERSPDTLTPAYCRNKYRAREEHKEVLVAVGICSHLGCSPNGPVPAGGEAMLDHQWGFLCPCHGSTFDLSGRVWKAKPAPDNLEIPPHRYLSDTRLLIGDDKQGA